LLLSTLSFAFVAGATSHGTDRDEAKEHNARQRAGDRRLRIDARAEKKTTFELLLSVRFLIAWLRGVGWHRCCDTFSCAACQLHSEGKGSAPTDQGCPGELVCHEGEAIQRPRAWGHPPNRGWLQPAAHPLPQAPAPTPLRLPWRSLGRPNHL
jgi:hypothetical protein